MSASETESDGIEAVDLQRAYTEHKEDVIARFGRAYVYGQLERFGGNISRAARASGLERMHFKRLLRRYGQPSTEQRSG